MYRGSFTRTTSRFETTGRLVAACRIPPRRGVLAARGMVTQYFGRLASKNVHRSGIKANKTYRSDATTPVGMSLCSKCVSVVRHEGTPEGKFEIIGGVRTYVATPTGDYPKDKAILYLPDVFGIDLINAQLIADDFARNGFKVYAVDYLNDDSMPTEDQPGGAKVDLFVWLAKHGQDTTRPPLDKVIAALKGQGVTQFAATGYCFGARYVFDLAFDEVIKAAAVAHPSLLKVPEDLEKIKQMGVPLLINSCEVDQMFPHGAQAQADKILGGGAQTSALYQREYFSGCEHGFAVRGDLSKPEVKAGKEGAFKATVEFFWKHF